MQKAQQESRKFVDLKIQENFLYGSLLLNFLFPSLYSAFMSWYLAYASAPFIFHFFFFFALLILFSNGFSGWFV